MRTATLLFPGELAERDVAIALEQHFGAAWFPEHHRCSIDTEDAFVAIDVDQEYAARLGPDEQQALMSQVGFVPKTALHVQSSTYHAGSQSLAEQVVQVLGRLFNGGRLSAL